MWNVLKKKVTRSDGYYVTDHLAGGERGGGGWGSDSDALPSGIVLKRFARIPSFSDELHKASGTRTCENPYTTAAISKASTSGVTVHLFDRKSSEGEYQGGCSRSKRQGQSGSYRTQIGTSDLTTIQNHPTCKLTSKTYRTTMNSKSNKNETLLKELSDQKNNNEFSSVTKSVAPLCHRRRRATADNCDVTAVDNDVVPLSCELLEVRGRKTSSELKLANDDEAIDADDENGNEDYQNTATRDSENHYIARRQSRRPVFASASEEGETGKVEQGSIGNKKGSQEDENQCRQDGTIQNNAKVSPPRLKCREKKSVQARCEESSTSMAARSNRRLVTSTESDSNVGRSSSCDVTTTDARRSSKRTKLVPPLPLASDVLKTTSSNNITGHRLADKFFMVHDHVDGPMAAKSYTGYIMIQETLSHLDAAHTVFHSPERDNIMKCPSLSNDSNINQSTNDVIVLPNATPDVIAACPNDMTDAIGGSSPAISNTAVCVKLYSKSMTESFDTISAKLLSQEFCIDADADKTTHDNCSKLCMISKNKSASDELINTVSTRDQQNDSPSGTALEHKICAVKESEVRDTTDIIGKPQAETSSIATAFDLSKYKLNGETTPLFQRASLSQLDSDCSSVDGERFSASRPTSYGGGEGSESGYATLEDVRAQMTSSLMYAQNMTSPLSQPRDGKVYGSGDDRDHHIRLLNFTEGQLDCVAPSSGPSHDRHNTACYVVKACPNTAFSETTAKAAVVTSPIPDDGVCEVKSQSGEMPSFSESIILTEASTSAALQHLATAPPAATTKGTTGCPATKPHVTEGIDSNENTFGIQKATPLHLGMWSGRKSGGLDDDDDLLLSVNSVDEPTHMSWQEVMREAHILGIPLSVQQRSVATGSPRAQPSLPWVPPAELHHDMHSHASVSHKTFPNQPETFDRRSSASSSTTSKSDVSRTSFPSPLLHSPDKLNSTQSSKTMFVSGGSGPGDFGNAVKSSHGGVRHDPSRHHVTCHPHDGCKQVISSGESPWKKLTKNRITGHGSPFKEKLQKMFSKIVHEGFGAEKNASETMISSMTSSRDTSRSPSRRSTSAEFHRGMDLFLGVGGGANRSTDNGWAREIIGGGTDGGQRQHQQYRSGPPSLMGCSSSSSSSASSSSYYGRSDKNVDRRGKPSGVRQITPPHRSLSHDAKSGRVTSGQFGGNLIVPPAATSANIGSEVVPEMRNSTLISQDMPSSQSSTSLGSVFFSSPSHSSSMLGYPPQSPAQNKSSPLHVSQIKFSRQNSTPQNSSPLQVFNKNCISQNSVIYKASAIRASPDSVTVQCLSQPLTIFNKSSPENCTNETRTSSQNSSSQNSSVRCPVSSNGCSLMFPCKSNSSSSSPPRRLDPSGLDIGHLASTSKDTRNNRTSAVVKDVVMSNCTDTITKHSAKSETIQTANWSSTGNDCFENGSHNNNKTFDSEKSHNRIINNTMNNNNNDSCNNNTTGTVDLITGLQQLKKRGWYWGPLDWEQAEVRLSGRPDGSFLVRDSSDERYILSLSFRSLGSTHHTRIEHYKGQFSFYAQPSKTLLSSPSSSSNIVDFIERAINESRGGHCLYFLRPRSPGQSPVPVQLLFPVSNDAAHS